MRTDRMTIRDTAQNGTVDDIFTLKMQKNAEKCNVFGIFYLKYKQTYVRIPM